MRIGYGVTGQTDTQGDQKKCTRELASMGEQPVFPLSGIKISEIRSINSAPAL